MGVSPSASGKIGKMEGQAFIVHDLLNDARYQWSTNGIMWSLIRRFCLVIFSGLRKFECL
jgi:hypothetical protein